MNQREMLDGFARPQQTSQRCVVFLLHMARMAHAQMTGDITAGVFMFSTARISLGLIAICFPFIAFLLKVSLLRPLAEIEFKT